MGFKEVETFDCDRAYALGGTNKKTGKPNPKSVEGYFLGSKEVANKLSKTGKGFLHIFQTSKGTDGIFGKTDLDRKLKGVIPGTMTRASWTPATVPSNKGNPMIVFKVEQDTANTIEVDGVDTSNTEVESSEAEAETYASEEEQEDDLPEEEEQAEEEAERERPQKPSRAAQAPSKASQDKVRAMLGKNKK